MLWTGAVSFLGSRFETLTPQLPSQGLRYWSLMGYDGYSNIKFKVRFMTLASAALASARSLMTPMGLAKTLMQVGDRTAGCG